MYLQHFSALDAPHVPRKTIKPILPSGETISDSKRKSGSDGRIPLFCLFSLYGAF